MANIQLMIMINMIIMILLLKLNKPENPFQNYELAKKLLQDQKKFFSIKNVLIQPLEVQKPETGRKTGPRTRENLCANESV